MPRTRDEQERSARLMGVQWTKAHNYFASLAREFLAAQADFDRNAYGESSFGSWLALRAGLNDTQIIRMLDLFKRGISEEARVAVNANLEEKARVKRREKLEAAQEAAALREANLVLKQQREADALAKLIDHAKQAAQAVRIADKAQGVPGRRQINLEYGKALLALRKDEANKNRFNDLLKEHGLEVGTPGFRSDAIWMAENWSDLLSKVSQCPHSNPMNVRTWWREQQGTRKPRTGGGGRAPSPKVDAAREIVRPLVAREAAGERIDWSSVRKEHGIANGTFWTAIKAEREILAATTTAAPTTIAAAPTTIAAAPTTIAAAAAAAAAGPTPAADQTDAPLTRDEYARLTMALREHQGCPRCAAALDLVIGKREALRGPDESRPPRFNLVS